MIITGQTGTGKTSYAFARAREIKGEILSVDARQIYKKLDIVTGKDIQRLNFTSMVRIYLDQTGQVDIGFYQKSGVRIWGYDLIDPRQRFSSHNFKIVAHYILQHVMNKNSMAIIVGGSHLYLQDLIKNFDVEVPADWKLRMTLEGKSVVELQNILKHLGEKMLTRMNESDRANPRRLMRKIEIAEATQRSLKKPDRWEHLPLLQVHEKIGFMFSSLEECRRILKKRVGQRLAQGALKEVKALLAEGYTKNDPGLHTIGCTQLISYCKGACSLEEATEKWLNAEVAYAKRQLTFMKKDTNIAWRKI